MSCIKSSKKIWHSMSDGRVKIAQMSVETRVNDEGQPCKATLCSTILLKVPEQLDASNPTRKPALDYVQRFEASHGAGCAR